MTFSDLQDKIYSVLSNLIKDKLGLSISYIDCSGDYKIIEIVDIFQAQDESVIDLCKFNIKKLLIETFDWKCTSDFNLPYSSYNIVESRLIFELTQEQVNVLIGYCGIIGGKYGNNT